MSGIIEEIRINPNYTQFVKSEFEGGDTRKDSEPVVRRSLTLTQDYIEKLEKTISVEQSILPPNCRYIEKTASGTIVVIEEPPAYRTISVSYSMKREVEILEADNKIEEYGVDVDFYRNSMNAPFKFNLAMPYVIHVLLFDKYDSLMAGSVYLRTARLLGPSDYLLKMPMMNISSEGYICYGDKGGGKHTSLTGSIENTIMVFWSASFNADYTYNYDAYRHVAGVNTYIGWQAMSQKDPMFIYNVEWIKMPENVQGAIDKLKRHSSSSGSRLGYRTLSQLFTQPADSGVEEKIKRKSKSKRTSRLFYDITQGLYLDGSFFLHVGDPVKWGKHNAHIDSFIGFFDSDKIRWIRLYLGNGKKVMVRFNKLVESFILEQAKSERFSSEGTLKNGVVVKPDSILIMKSAHGGNVYKKVHYIRKAVDGMSEARIGNAFYILENIEGELMDLQEPKYQGREINKDEEYIVITSRNDVPLHGGVKAKFSGIDVSSMGSLRLDFIATTGRSKGHRLALKDNNPGTNINLLFSKDEYEQAPPIFSNGRYLMCLREHGSIVEDQAWITPAGIAFDHNYQSSSPTINDVQKHLLSEDGSVFKVKGFNNDLEFRVGDKVVYSDWKNPINMLIIRTITGFVIDKEKSSLAFVLADKDGHLTQVDYITCPNHRSSSSPRANQIHIGRIRKITNQFKRVHAGTKIIAEKGYIPHFPKKDVNIIIGFITDTGGDDPLVLCSNCCTLWYSDMMKDFKRVTIKSKKWPQLAHAPVDITKIKMQPGDILGGDSDYRSSMGWMVHRQKSNRGLKMINLANYNSFMDTYTLDAYTKSHMYLDCIPNPRMSPTIQGKLKAINAWPNFHGLFIEHPTAPCAFLEDGRSLLHVSDSH